jgi:hypothetical protein
MAQIFVSHSAKDTELVALLFGAFAATPVWPILGEFEANLKGAANAGLSTVIPHLRHYVCFDPAKQFWQRYLMERSLGIRRNSSSGIMRPSHSSRRGFIWRIFGRPASAPVIRASSVTSSGLRPRGGAVAPLIAG